MTTPNEPGPATDASGRPVFDPTANVISLNEASVQRLDDLAALRDTYLARLEDLRRYYDQLLRERDDQLRKAESDRIDAIRAVDVGNVQRAAEVAAAQADTLRNQVAATAAQAQTSLAAALDPIQKDIADLRRAQYEAQGSRAQVVEARGASGALYAAIGVGISVVLALLAVLAFLAANGGR